MIHFGQISSEEFLAEYWQKKPLLIKHAIPNFISPLSPDELAGLSCEEEFESRVVKGSTQRYDWTLESGPFKDDYFESMPKNDWTLLVQGVDKHILDDVMISFAAQGGSVGPHYDHYDVFLLQGLGSRHWQISSLDCNSNNYVKNSELRIAAVVTIGSIHGGVRSNIIPESLYMLGTIRTLDNKMKEVLLKRLEEIVKNIAEANNAKAKITYQVTYPITYNDPDLYEQMLPSLQRINGSENVNSMNAITGAEDFSFFQEKIPGIYFFIGGAKKGTDPLKAAPHHTPDFYVDDSAMITGLRSMTTLALDYLKNNK